MKLLDQIVLKNDKRIELYHGDLTALTAEDSFDLLVISAFRNDYTPTRTSLIGALARKGISVADLAKNKEIDLRENFSCWLSQELISPPNEIYFKRILCFEPYSGEKIPEIVGDIFRALTPITAEKKEIKTIAMPLLATGHRQYPVEEILLPLLDASINWLENGIPLETIKIVVYLTEDEKKASQIFSEKKSWHIERAKQEQIILESPAEEADPFYVYSPVERYDIFISYSHRNTKEMEVLLEEIQKQYPDAEIFLDRNNIDIGAAWQIEIFESLDKCKKIVTLLSPDYLSSKVCIEEYNIAWLRERESNEQILFPIYLYSTNLPTYMKYKNYYDCREADPEKIKTMANQLCKILRSLSEAKPSIVDPALPDDGQKDNSVTSKPDHNTPLTELDRLKLKRKIRELIVADFNDLLDALDVPAGIIPPSQAEGASRVDALWNWAKSPTGCGLEKLLIILQEIIGKI